MNTELKMSARFEEIREQQHDTWERFAAGWKKWDGMALSWLAPFGEAMLRKAGLREDAHVLDIATGTGEPGLTAARRVPRGRVTLTDLAEHMLAVASEHVALRGLDNVETRVCETGALPFADASFDAVLCRFGYMFFPDIGIANREFVRVARPGARVCAAIWSDPLKNPWATTILGTIARHVDLPAPPPGSPGLFRCAGTGYMREVFIESGLKDVHEEEVATDMLHESPEHYWTFMNDVAAPVVAGLAKVDAATREKIKAEVLHQARRTPRDDGGIRLRSTATVIVGTR